MDENQKAYLRALRLLAVKARFRTELKARLRQERFSDEAIAYALEKCVRYFNDEELGKSKIRTKAKKGYGPRYLAASLKAHLDEDILAKAFDEFDEKKVLIEYLEKHPKLLQDPKAKLRLLRRGFSYDIIQNVLNFAK